MFHRVFKLLIDVDFVKQQLHVLNFENGAVFFIQVLGVCGAEFSFGIISLLKKYGVILDQVPDSFVRDVDFLPGLEPEAPCRGPKTVQTILEKCGQGLFRPRSSGTEACPVLSSKSVWGCEVGDGGQKEGIGRFKASSNKVSKLRHFRHCFLPKANCLSARALYSFLFLAEIANFR